MVTQSKKINIKKGGISEVLAKVMAVAVEQKRLQLKEVISDFEVDIDSYE